MKVDIGNYVNWFGPYQFADKVFFFLSEDRREKIGDWLPEKPFEVWNSWFRQRKVEVQIDGWDTWSVDDTLATIIHPLLVEFRKNINGWPTNIDSADVPDSVYQNIESADEKELKKWEWIIDEMIWGFDQIINEDLVDLVDEGDKFDMEKYRVWNERVNRATLLFGKYYRNLWC